MVREAGTGAKWEQAMWPPRLVEGKFMVPAKFATEKEAMQFARWVNLAGKYEAITREKKS